MSQHVDTTSDPIARRALNTAKTAVHAGQDPIDEVQKALDAIGQPSMYWAEDDCRGVRIGDFHGRVDIVVYHDQRDPVAVLSPVATS